MDAEHQPEQRTLQDLAELLQRNGELIAKLVGVRGDVFAKQYTAASCVNIAVLRERRTEAGLSDEERGMLASVRNNIAQASLHHPVRVTVPNFLQMVVHTATGFGKPRRALETTARAAHPAATC